eukprot:2964172-Prymnesium_polylepis.1
MRASAAASEGSSAAQEGAALSERGRCGTGGGADARARGGGGGAAQRCGPRSVTACASRRGGHRHGAHTLGGRKGGARPVLRAHCAQRVRTRWAGLFARSGMAFEASGVAFCSVSRSAAIRSENIPECACAGTRVHFELGHDSRVFLAFPRDARTPHRRH